MLKKSVLFAMICLLIPAICFAIIPIPARIGGTVTIDGEPLTQAQADHNYTFMVTSANGITWYAQTEVLNSSDWYNIDIPIYDANDQTGGAHPGDSLKIYVSDNITGAQLNVTSPPGGLFNCGDSGSTTQINLAAQATATSIPTLSEWGMILFSLLMAASVIYTMRRNNAFDQSR
jgi:hypothetical protein